jgi:hypothetical protein
MSERSDPAGLGLGDHFHIGIVVDDVETAMAELAGQLGTAWRPVQEAEVPMLDGEGLVATVPMCFTYSAGGPPAVELVRTVPGTVFTAEAGAVHHVGYWVDDLPAASAALSAGGWPLVATMAGGPDGGPSRFALHATGVGPLVELVDRTIDRPYLQDLVAATRGPAAGREDHP